MKVAIATVQVPFVTGGAEILTQMLRSELIKRNHQADIISLPFKWYPTETLLNTMTMARMMDLTEVNGMKIDKVIATKFPVYYLKHNNKTLWLMHQHRQAYDLWGTDYGDIHKQSDGEFVREMITSHDSKYISEAKAVYTIAQNTSNRLMKYNNISSQVLYHPPINHEKMNCKEYGDFVFYASRIDAMKRQRLLVEAARYVKSNVKFVIAGSGVASELEHINSLLQKYKLGDKVKLVGFISEEEKLNYYANCLCVYFGAYDEDYGYITLEGFYSKKPVIVHHDAGGPLEFVENEINGFVINADAKELAEKIDMLYNERQLAKKMGEAGFESLKAKRMDWDYVIDKLLE